MTDLFGIVWLLTGICLVIFAILWIVASKKRTRTKGHKTMTLTSFFLSLIFFISFIVSVAIEPAPETANNKDITQSAEKASKVNVIINASQFSGITLTELKDIMGTPESVKGWNFKAPSRTYEATDVTYENNKFEFIIIDNKVVRLTYYGSTDEYSNDQQIPELFGIKMTPGMSVNSNGGSIRFGSIDDKIDDLWVTTLDIAATYKVTYDMTYFK
ncbi:hypothetical protein [Paenibacillus sp. L3-i20]|uniref:hypothetical protein n=1 Tax=Paenibacillus sp. L3-i20 TaxID=2905833 RepID=UPI001EDD4E91|nr:hypothetical protein [Paenibacillus sp. L3-i20]GKU79855.1 hypothetical protein L3i20_v242520 [Paenibacillus sp. L3-i20]